MCSMRGQGRTKVPPAFAPNPSVTIGWGRKPGCMPFFLSTRIGRRPLKCWAGCPNAAVRRGPISLKNGRCYLGRAMFYHDGKLQYTVRVEKPNPHFAKMLQQAIGGIEGEMRVALQYLFQAWGARGP